VATEEDVVIAFLDLAAGRMSEQQLSEWLEANCRKAVRKR
jgi:hypothetical protein